MHKIEKGDTWLTVDGTIVEISRVDSRFLESIKSTGVAYFQYEGVEQAVWRDGTIQGRAGGLRQRDYDLVQLLHSGFPNQEQLKLL